MLMLPIFLNQYIKKIRNILFYVSESVAARHVRQLRHGLTWIIEKNVILCSQHCKSLTHLRIYYVSDNSVKIHRNRRPIRLPAAGLVDVPTVAIVAAYQLRRGRRATRRSPPADTSTEATAAGLAQTTISRPLLAIAAGEAEVWSASKGFFRLLEIAATSSESSLTRRHANYCYEQICWNK